MADTKASHESKDALDEALAAALANALASNDSAVANQTKGARVRRHREAIVALRAKHWTWDQIAAKLSEAGLKVSARTVRLEMITSTQSGKKGARATTDGRHGRDGVAKSSKQRAVDAEAQRPATAYAGTVDSRHVGKPQEPRSTESGFYTIDEEDN